MTTSGLRRPLHQSQPQQHFPRTVVQLIDVGDKLIHHEERTEVIPAQRTAEATKWTKISNVDQIGCFTKLFNYMVSKKYLLR